MVFSGVSLFDHTAHSGFIWANHNKQVFAEKPDGGV